MARVKQMIRNPEGKTPLCEPWQIPESPVKTKKNRLCLDRIFVKFYEFSDFLHLTSFQ
jgi:hypothetical protein